MHSQSNDEDEEDPLALSRSSAHRRALLNEAKISRLRIGKPTQQEVTKEGMMNLHPSATPRLRAENLLGGKWEMGQVVS